MTAGFRLHHIGFLVPDISAASEEWGRRFGYRRESAIIEDPVQTAFVQFLRLPRSPCWVELISPNGPNSKLSRALAMRPGFHHLCYEVDDIEAACRTERLQDMLVLSEPVPATAFGGRRIAWLVDCNHQLVELVETGPGPFCVESLFVDALGAH